MGHFCEIDSMIDNVTLYPFHLVVTRRDVPHGLDRGPEGKYLAHRPTKAGLGRLEQVPRRPSSGRSAPVPGSHSLGRTGTWPGLGS
jgi:hypothetical protein